MRFRSPALDLREDARNAAGFGLVEIVVSMFLIGIIAVAFLPLLIQSVLISADNITVATATQMVNSELEVARSQASTCTALANFTAETPVTMTDSRGVELHPYRALGSCPSELPGTISFTSTVERPDGTVVATATTLIFVSAE